MSSIFAEKTLELITALRLYIEQEHPKSSWIVSDPSTYAYFLEKANKQPTKVSAPPPIPVKSPPLKPQSNLRSTPAQPQEAIQAAYNPESSSKSAVGQKIKLSEPTQKETTVHPTAKTQPLSKTFVREISPASNRPDFKEMRTFFEKHLSSVALSDTIADDSIAKAQASRWNAPPADIIILSFNELPKEQAFISNLAYALNQCLASTKVLSASKIEREKGWDKLLKTGKLRLIIASNYNLQTLPELMKHFHEEATGKHRLGTTPLYLLSDLALYMQQAALKASLWKALCRSCQ